jgi:hypothetical protein
VFEQGGSFGKVLMIDLSLSLDDKNFITDTSHNTEFTKKLFGDLNYNILGPPGHDKVILHDDSDEEMEVQKEKTAGTEPMATTATVNLTSTGSTDTDDVPAG